MSAEHVKVALRDVSPDGSRVYKLADEVSYTHKYDTVRVARRLADTYVVQAWRKDGWTDLVEGNYEGGELPYERAVERAIAVLYR